MFHLRLRNPFYSIYGLRDPRTELHFTFYKYTGESRISIQNRDAKPWELSELEVDLDLEELEKLHARISESLTTAKRKNPSNTTISYRKKSS